MSINVPDIDKPFLCWDDDYMMEPNVLGEIALKCLYVCHKYTHDDTTNTLEAFIDSEMKQPRALNNAYRKALS